MSMNLQKLLKSLSQLTSLSDSLISSNIDAGKSVQLPYIFNLILFAIKALWIILNKSSLSKSLSYTSKKPV